MNMLDMLVDDSDIVFDNPDARIPLALVSREDLSLLVHNTIQKCLDICEEYGDAGKDGHECADAIAKLFKEVE
jgi:hypothetical protein